MTVSRLLVFSLLVAASVPSATAQLQFTPAAPTIANPFSSFGTQVAKPQQMPRFSVQSDPSRPTFSASWLELSQRTLDTIRERNVLGKVLLAERRVLGNAVVKLRESKACYAIRSYGFSREDPGSDAVRFTDSSTCQSAASVQLKAVADPRGVLRR